MTAFVKAMFEEGDGFAEPYNGMGQLGRVANEKVEYPTQKQR
jgi:hypothetical protein